MHNEDFLKRLIDILSNSNDIEKVKVTYKNGKALRIVFDNDNEEDDDDDEDDEEEIEYETVVEADKDDDDYDNDDDDDNDDHDDVNNDSSRE